MEKLQGVLGAASRGGVRSMAVTNPLGIDLDQYKYGFHDPEDTYAFKSRKGLDREIVEMISHMKSEPDWMRAFRLHSLGVWEKKPLPTWGGNVGEIDFNDIYYYVRPMENQGKTWEDVPENIKNTFDRLGIAEAGSYLHYVEGCTAPTYTSDSLHSAVVEIIVKEGARVRYTTIQNWSKNVYNLVTKRAVAYRDATMEWVDGNLGSKLTMKYPSVYMLEPGA